MPQTSPAQWIKLAIVTLVVGCLTLVLSPPLVHAQDNPDVTFHRAQVLEILNESRTEDGGYATVTQDVRLRLQDGQEVTAQYTLPLGASESRLLRPNLQVIAVSPNNLPPEQMPEDQYIVTDFYRFPSLLLVFGLFIVIIVVFAGLRGLTALAGLGISVALLLYYIVPQIAQGADPLMVSLVGSFIIAGVALYLAHGFNRRTTVALVSTLGTLALAIIAAISFVSFTKLFGLGSDESLDLQYGAIASLNLRGLLLAGMIIGALGVLDDITTAQAAAVDEIHKANPKLTPIEIYHRGMSVGREHITSLVNTLALAYAGSSLPMLLLFTIYQQPLWVTLNSEFVVEEVVRTVVGSLALTLAVPITTALAAWWLPKHPMKAGPSQSSHAHSHT